MHPAISYDLAKARIADLRHQAQSDALARAVTRLSRSAPRSHRNQIWQTTTPAPPSSAARPSQGVPMTRYRPASGHRPGQRGPWIGAEEQR